MNPHTALLIASFISRNYGQLQEHLEAFEIEGTEAELILKELRALHGDESEIHEILKG